MGSVFEYVRFKERGGGGWLATGICPKAIAKHRPRVLRIPLHHFHREKAQQQELIQTSPGQLSQPKGGKFTNRASLGREPISRLSGWLNDLRGVTEDAGISQHFIGIILLPIVGNACEHAAAVRFAIQETHPVMSASLSTSIIQVQTALSPMCGSGSCISCC